MIHLDNHNSLIHQAMTWCARVIASTRPLKWSMISMDRYAVVLKIRALHSVYICKITLSPVATFAPLVYEKLSFSNNVPKLLCSERIQDGWILLFEYITFSPLTSTFAQVLPVLATIQEETRSSVQATLSPTLISNENLLHAFEYIDVPLSYNIIYSPRVLRWAGASIGALNSFSIDDFMTRWSPTVATWIDILGNATDYVALDHPDLHLGNAPVSLDGSCFLLDWDDARMASPFLSLDKIYFAFTDLFLTKE